MQLSFSGLKQRSPVFVRHPVFGSHSLGVTLSFLPTWFENECAV